MLRKSKVPYAVSLSILLGVLFITCKQDIKNSQAKEAQIKTNSTEGLVVYKTKNLVLKKLSDNVYEHVSFMETESFGRVGCNGMLVVNNNKAIVFDTPTDSISSLELIDFITKKLKNELIGVIPTHFHDDCLGGINVFEKYDIPIYANQKTIGLLIQNKKSVPKKHTMFKDRLTLDVGGEKVDVTYFGEGHTKDNVVGYFSKDKAVFGGCLVKMVGAGKGFLGDSNIGQWSKTITKLKAAYPDAKIVIPGHGKWGGVELFDYTIQLFE